MRLTNLLAFILLLSFCVTGQGVQLGFDLSNYGVKIEADRRLIVVLAALEMAETKTPAGSEKLINTPLSEKGTKFRTQLLQDTAALDPDLRRRISAFVTQYKKRHPNFSDAQIVAPFMSMALTLTPAPEFADPVITNDLPGSLLDVLDFAPLAREFYRRSGINSKLDEYARSYGREADGVLRSSTREMVSELLDYLHTRPQLFSTEKTQIETQKTKSKTKIKKVETRVLERHFFIVPEMLAAQGNVNFLNARDDYYVILPPDKDLSFSDVRRAFLQFVIDPLVLSNSKDITALRDWVRPQLDERRKTDPSITPDVFLTVSRSLAAAVDIRQAEFVKKNIATDQARRKIDTMKTDAEKRAVSAELEKFKQSLADESVLRLFEDHEKGLVLTFFFAEKLKEIEESGFDIAASLGDMIASFDPAKESTSIAATVDARTRALAAREERKSQQGSQIVVVENPVTVRLREIQKSIDAKDLTKAAADLKQLQTQNPNDPRIFYNLGRVAALEATKLEDADAQAAKLIEAKEAYSKVIEVKTVDTDPALLSLTYVALARIYEHFNNNAMAIKLYDEAIKLGRVGAFNDAMAGMQRLIKLQ
ncbi:MAG: hypothetical protein IPL32_04160 [Chloracidobacterium sp.]|nr:hypothetical protein [Chloracidobacterium sp.]